MGHVIRAPSTPSRLRMIGASLVLATAAAGLAEPLRVGFVGLRHGHSWRQLSEVTGIDGVEFVGVAESIRGLLQEARRVHPDVHYEEDYRAFVKKTKPHIVWAFVENNRHLEMVEFLAPLGVHVIFEKPLAGSYADAVRIQELARDHDIQVMTNYPIAWWPSSHGLRNEAASGKIGKVWRLHGVAGNKGPAPVDQRRRVFFDWLTDPEANGAGALVDFGIYNAAWSVWHLGLPSQVHSVLHRLQPDRFPRVDDNAVMVLSYPSAVGIFESSWHLPRGIRRLEVFGSTGSLTMDGQALWLRDGRKGPVRIDSPPLPREARHPIRYMIDRIRNGQPLEHILALDANVDAVQILEAAKRSARTGRSVALPLAHGNSR